MSGARARRKQASDEVELFLDMMATERGASVNTLDSYRRDLEDYSAFLHGKRRTVEAATTADIRAYLAALTRTLVAPVAPSAVPSGTRLFVTLRTAMTPSAADTESPAANALFVPLTTVPDVRR